MGFVACSLPSPSLTPVRSMAAEGIRSTKPIHPEEGTEDCSPPHTRPNLGQGAQAPLGHFIGSPVETGMVGGPGGRDLHLIWGEALTCV